MTRLDECQVSGQQKKHRPYQVRNPHDQILLEPVETGNHRVEGVEIEEQGARKLERAAQPADLTRPPSEDPDRSRGRHFMRDEPVGIGGLKQLQIRRSAEGD